MKGLFFLLLAPALWAQDLSPELLRDAATRSIALLQKGSAGFSKAQDCLSCHHTGLPAGALELARRRGIPVPLNEIDKHGYTPLLYASTVDYGDDRMVQLLLAAGADPKLRAKGGETALSHAKKYQYPHIQSALQKAGAQE